jgi:hypothetical protein
MCSWRTRFEVKVVDCIAKWRLVLRDWNSICVGAGIHSWGAAWCTHGYEEGFLFWSSREKTSNNDASKWINQNSNPCCQNQGLSHNARVCNGELLPMASHIAIFLRQIRRPGDWSEKQNILSLMHRWWWDPFWTWAPFGYSLILRETNSTQTGVRWIFDLLPFVFQWVAIPPAQQFVPIRAQSVSPSDADVEGRMADSAIGRPGWAVSTALEPAGSVPPATGAPIRLWHGASSLVHVSHLNSNLII